ncbi:MAG: hypothetical protein V7637_2496 [Mycobacteriales bacterium]|jgi:hypothetical protein
MPGLIRGVARTAVVAGTATAVSNRVARRQAGRWAAQQTDYEQRPAPAVERPTAADDVSSRLAQLTELAELKTRGVLTEAEFDQQKARILGP